MTGRGPFSADYPFKPHTMDLGGAATHYIDEPGDGELTFVLMHGNSTWSYMYRNITPHLLPKGRCVAPDLIGHGKSDKPDVDYRYVTQYKYVERFLGEFGLTNIVFVLYDLGGSLGLNYAMQHEADVRGIAMWETFVRTFDSWDDWPRDLLEGFKAFRTQDVGWDLIVNKNVFMEEVLPYGINRDLSEAEMKAYLDPHGAPANRKMLWVWPQELPIENDPEDTEAIVKDYVAKLGQSQVPKLLFWAKPGAIVPEETVALSRANFPNLEDVFLGESGRYLAEDFLHEIGEKIASWVEGFD